MRKALGRFQRDWIFRGSSFLVILLFSACSSDTTTFRIFEKCNIPGDQAGSISGKWPLTPIPIAFQSGDWSAFELQELTRALTHWNEFFTRSKGFNIFDFGEVGNPRQVSQARSSAICSSGLITGGQYTGNVVIYKVGANWVYGSDVVALTSFCPAPSSPYDRIFNGIMEFNYQNFFTTGNKVPDLTSIFLHELGHMIGMDHSCETFTKTGIPLCANSPPAYLVAVLYPIILFPNGLNGEVRRVLQQNDQERANCVY